MAFLIAGKGRYYIDSRHSNVAQCPNCGEIDTTDFSVFANYFQLYYIPIFPMEKHGLVMCSNCDFSLKEFEMPIDIKEEYDYLTKDIKRPIWQYTGLIIIFLVVMWYKIIH